MTDGHRKIKLINDLFVIVNSCTCYLVKKVLLFLDVILLKVKFAK